VTKDDAVVVGMDGMSDASRKGVVYVWRLDIVDRNECFRSRDKLTNTVMISGLVVECMVYLPHGIFCIRQLLFRIDVLCHTTNSMH
jgi:hypothetical protein